MAKKFRFPSGAVELSEAISTVAVKCEAPTPVQSLIQTIGRMFGDRDRALEDFLNTLPAVTPGGSAFPITFDDGTSTYYARVVTGSLRVGMETDANVNYEARTRYQRFSATRVDAILEARDDSTGQSAYAQAEIDAGIDSSAMDLFANSITNGQAQVISHANATTLGYASIAAYNSADISLVEVGVTAGTHRARMSSGDGTALGASVTASNTTASDISNVSISSGSVAHGVASLIVESTVAAGSGGIRWTGKWAPGGQIVATGPVGTVVAKLPVYNASYTLIGYMPVYATIT